MVLTFKEIKGSFWFPFLRVGVCVLLVLYLCLSSTPVLAGDSVSREHLIKAAFVYNFLKFVEWNTNTSSITICVIGDGPMSVALESLEERKIERTSLSVMQCGAWCSVGRCRVVFVSRQWRGNLKKLLRKCESAGVLTISDVDGFVDDGGIIGLKKEGGRIRFEVNLRAAKEAHVFVSSKLLKLARRVVK